MHYVKSANIWMYLGSELMIKISLLDLLDVLLIVTGCGKLVWTYYLNIGGKGLQLHSPVDWLLKYWNEERFHFTVPPGQISGQYELLSSVDLSRHGWN